MMLRKHRGLIASNSPSISLVTISYEAYTPARAAAPAVVCSLHEEYTVGSLGKPAVARASRHAANNTGYFFIFV